MSGKLAKQRRKLSRAEAAAVERKLEAFRDGFWTSEERGGKEYWMPRSEAERNGVFFTDIQRNERWMPHLGLIAETDERLGLIRYVPAQGKAATA
jgi:hypothetical protein